MNRRPGPIVNILLAAGMLAASAAASAQGFSAVVSPPRFEAGAQPGTTYRNIVEVGNVSGEAAHFTVKTADWTLQYVQQGNLGPGGSGRTGDPDITGVAVGPGTYTLSERPTNPAAPTAGYTTTGWTCDATNPVVVNPDGTATLTLVPDDLDVTCTIANTWTGHS